MCFFQGVSFFIHTTTTHFHDIDEPPFNDPWYLMNLKTIN